MGYKYLATIHQYAHIQQTASPFSLFPLEYLSNLLAMD